MIFNPRDNKSYKIAVHLDSAAIGLGIFGESISHVEIISSTEENSRKPNISSGARNENLFWGRKEK